MKIKEIDRTASVAWSPAKLDNIYLAAGTAAQQLDSSFSTNAALELYQLNVNEPGLDVPIKATYNCESRFHKLVWGCHGVGGEKNEFPAGLIVGGCDGGVMQVFNAYKLFQNEDPIVLTKSKHAGPVRALDFNCFRPNLIASGASESEIFIWDLTNPKVPMSPGAKIQPADDVTDLEWNKQVEHILASTFPARCVVWDLRKNEPVIKVSDATSRIRYKCVRWHPEVATQMCLASEDDASPVIQLWDLRYATSPLRVIQGHQRGILGMSWCAQDPELLLTCGKDSRILCWNPNYAHAGYEMVLDIPTSSQWSFDVSFCPKNPIVASSCTFDGRISMYGLSGGAQQPVTSSKLADSFPGMDMSMSHAPLPTQPTTSQQLRDPPKWMKRPSGVSFAFGGRLISFQNVKTPATQAGQPDRITGMVNISQIVTLPEFIDRSKKLEEALQTGSLEFYCSEKARVATDSQEARIWEFLQASFSQNPRQAYVSLLGFNTSEMLTKLQEVVNTGDIDALINNFDGLGNDNSQDNLGTLSGYQNGFGGLDIDENIPEFSVPTDDSTDGRINQALLCGNIDLAVYLCLETERWADAFLLASKGSAELMIKAQSKYFQKVKGKSTNMIRAVVRQDLNYLVSNCELDSWKQVLATALTYADETGFQTVAETLGQRLLKSEDDNLVQGALLCFICSGSLNHLVDAWVGGSGKGSSPDELQDLVEQVMILKKAADMWGRDANLSGGSLADKMIEYASILASQGCLDTALNYLKDSNDPSINALKERLQLSLGYVKPTRQQIAPRSRQTSESSASGLRYKRPSHPSAPVKRGSDLYQQTDFSNLTGPVQPPSAYSSSSGLNSGYGASQYSPAPPSNNPGLLTYSQTNSANSVPSGLPPRPPTTATPGAVPALYNPTEAAAEMVPPTSHDTLQRKMSGGALPRPPVSNVASGWNDPPPIMVKSKTPHQPSNNQQLITHPIFGSAPEPVQSMPYSYGSNAPPSTGPPGGTSLPPPPTAASKPYGTGVPPPNAATQPYGSAITPPSNAANQPYGGSMPPPPSAANQPYGTNFPPPPTAANQPYGTQVPPPPTAASQSYGAPAPPMAASQPYGSSTVPSIPTSQYGAAIPPPPTAASQPYGSTITPPPSASGQLYGSAMNPPPPPSAAAQPYGSNILNPSAGAPYGTGISSNQPYGSAVPPPPTAANQPYGSAFAPPPSAANQPYGSALPPPPTAAAQPYGAVRY